VADTAVLEILANTAKYAAGLKSLGPITDKEALKAAVALQTRGEAAQAKLAAAAEKAASQAAAAWAKEAATQAAAVNAEIDAAERAAAAHQKQMQAIVDQTMARLAANEAEQKALAAKNALIAAENAQAAAIKAASWQKTIEETEHYAKGTIGAGLAAERSAKLTRMQAASIKNLGAQLADIGKGLASGVSPFTIMTQQGDQLVAALSGIVPAGSAVLTTLSGLATVAAPLALGLGILVGVMNDYTAAEKEATRANEAFKAALLPLDEAIAAAAKEQELLNKALESGSAEKYLAIADLSAAADRKEAEATKALREERDKLMQGLAEMSNMDSFQGQLDQQRVRNIEAELAAVHQKANELASLSVTNYTLREAIEGADDAEGKRTKTTKASTKAADEAAEAAAEWAHQLAVLREGAGLAKLNDRLIEIGHAEAEGAIAATDAIELKKQAQQEYGDAVAAQIIAERTERLAMIEAVGKAQSDLWEQYIDDAQKAADKQKEIEDERREKTLATTNAVIDLGKIIASGVGDIAGTAASTAEQAAQAAYAEIAKIQGLIAGLNTAEVDAAGLVGEALVAAYKSGAVAAEDLSDAQKAALDARLTAEQAAAEKVAALQEEAALKAWKTQQKASLATTGFLTAQAILQSLSGAPFPANLFLAAGATAAAGFQVAAIKSAEPPTFSDTPGMYRAGPQGAYVAPGDTVVAAKDPAKVQQMAGGDGSTTVNLMLRNRTLQTVYAEGSRQPGAIRNGNASRRPGRIPPWER
jgi:hypothetical protein